MTTAPANISPLTPADVAQLSDEHGKLYELVHGVLLEKPVRSARSGGVTSQLAFLLNCCYPRIKAYVIVQQPTYCFADPQHMRRPDVLLIWEDRLPQGLTDEELYVAPDFVVEVASPDRTWSDIVVGRLEEYLGAGVPLVWVIDPGLSSVHAYRRDGSISLYRSGDTIKDESLLPGLSIRVTDIFADRSEKTRSCK